MLKWFQHSSKNGPDWIEQSRKVSIKKTLRKPENNFFTKFLENFEKDLLETHNFKKRGDSICLHNTVYEV